MSKPEPYEPTHTHTVTHTLEPDAGINIDARARLAEYVSRGFILLTPEDLNVDANIHSRIHQQTTRALSSLERQRAETRDRKQSGLTRRAPPEQVDRGLATPALASSVEKKADATNKLIFYPNLAAEVPELSSIFASTGFRTAVESILGPDWAVVPFGSSVIPAGAHDQHWHKDDLLPWNARKPGLRHHHLEAIDMFYYPQTVFETIAPTALVPHSQYWTFDHDENNDNICIEMLDYNFVRERMGESPDLEERDRRFDKAVADTAWPLVRQSKLCVRQGSVVLMNHNCFHRGQRRQDDPSCWAENPRYMWRFWLYRTTEPPAVQTGELTTGTSENVCRQLLPSVDPLTNIPLHSPDAAVVWESVFAWATSSDTPSMTTQQSTLKLKEQLYLCGDQTEPQRIAAAYHLAATTDGIAALRHAFTDDRESVRRAATHGIVAAGPDVTREVALDVAQSSSSHKWARKNAAWALGESAPADAEVVRTLGKMLEFDQSVHVRATCAASLGLVGRRALRDGRLAIVDDVVSKLIECLKSERNRPCQAIAQNRGIYDIRPTDESDMCEGSGAPPGEIAEAILRPDGKSRFSQVRSAVRENALWSAVTLATPRKTKSQCLPTSSIEALHQMLLHVIRTDDNVISCGFALDAICRLAALQGDEAIIQSQRLTDSEPVVCIASMWQARRLTDECQDILTEKGAN